VTYNDPRNAAPQCRFYVRTPATEDPPTYDYQAVYLRGSGYGQSGTLVTPHPPAVGDQIYLTDESGPHTGEHRVIARSWSHPQYGSAAWPAGTKWPKDGPLLTVIVEPAPGLFHDEAESADETEE
jgi:hypothetical protein